MSKEALREIKKGETGHGLLIESDAGFISADIGDNKKLFEDINTEASKNNEFYCPNPFIVSAVFQKYGIENANGRIYPEHILKREVEKYQNMIKQRMAIGECYRPEAQVLTQSGWKRLDKVVVGENVLTLNPENKNIEIQPIKNIVNYRYTGNLIHIQGAYIDDWVTPDHGFPVFNADENFEKFVTASEIMTQEFDESLYIPTIENDKNHLCVLSTEEVPYDDNVMCIEVDNHIWYVMDNRKCHWTKNCNHPSESVIDLSRVAINIIELHWEGHTLVGKMEILVSEGFRRYGLITCEADQVAHLILKGIKIGVSSRGLGNVINKMGVLYVDEDFELVCWDVVSSPSTPNAYIATNYEDLQPYIESKESEKPVVLEKLDRFNDWLND